MSQRDGASCPGCGLPNYEGLCPVCRGDYPAYVEELQPFFGPWAPLDAEDYERAKNDMPEKVADQPVGGGA